jgi:hypothetical protein
MTRPSAILLLLIAAFCAYGYLASFEPGPRADYFRIGYAVAGLLCLIGVAALYIRRPH